MKKKLIICLILLTFFTACGKKNENENNDSVINDNNISQNITDPSEDNNSSDDKDTTNDNTNKPSTGGNTTKPSTGGSTNKPSTGGSTTKPSTGGSTNKPSTGGTTGGSTNKPSTGGSTGGTTGGSTNKPSTGGSTNKPSTGGSTGGSTDKPSTGGSTGGSTNKPTTPTGKLKIKYVDENNNSIKTEVTDNTVKVNQTYSYDAPNITDYIIINKKESVTIKNTTDVNEIVFKYAYINYVPYISMYYVKPKVAPGENVTLDFYVTDYFQEEYKDVNYNNEFKITINVTGKSPIVKTVKAGDNSISIGSFSNAGEVDYSIVATDKYNRNSHEIFGFFRVESANTKNTYVMTTNDLTKYGITNVDTYEVEKEMVDLSGLENKTLPLIKQALKDYGDSQTLNSKTYKCFVADTDGDGKPNRYWGETYTKYAPDYDKDEVLQKSKNTRIGLQNFINDKQKEGYNYIKLLPGKYRIDHEGTIQMPSNLTLDMNGATIKLNQFTGDSALMLEINQVTDSHVINGTFVGDYYEHDYANSPNNSEWVMGVSFGNEALYSSFENITIKDITGYGAGNGISNRKPGAGYTKFIAGSLSNFKLGDIDRTNGNEVASKKRVVSDYFDMTKSGNNKYFQISRYLGYQGVSGSWNMIVHFYDSNKKYIKSTDAYQYRRIGKPDNTKYIRVTLFTTATPTDLSVHMFNTPTNSVFKNIVIDNARCVGMAPSAMSNLLFENIEISNSGQSSAKCALDAEDGWDQMQDVTFRKMYFHDNPNNNFLTCAGHNFIIEDFLGGSIYLWPRTKGYVIRNNTTKISGINAGYTSLDRTGYTRIYNNKVLNSMNTESNYIKNNEAKYFSGKNINYGKSIAIPSNGSVANNMTIVMDGSVNYLSALTLKNSTISHLEGVEENRLSFNGMNMNRLFDNVKFVGKTYFANHNGFNSGVFNNCKFDDLSMTVGMSDTEGDIIFNNSIINSTANRFISTGPHAYSKGRFKIVFNNCTFNLKDKTDLIYLFGTPINGIIEFNNCTFNNQGNTYYVNGDHIGSDVKISIKANGLNLQKNDKIANITGITINK